MGLFGLKVPIERNIHPSRDIRAAWRRNIHDQESMSKPNFQTTPEQTLKPDPNWWHAHALKAYEKKVWGRAKWLGRIGQILDPAHLPSSLVEGYAFYRAIQAEPALAAFRRCHYLRPDTPQAWDVTALLRHTLGERKAAIKAAKRFALVTPDNPASCHNLFHMLRADMRDREAEGWLRRTYFASKTPLVVAGKDTAFDERAETAAFEQGMLRLSRYQWADGWPDYDRRLRLLGSQPNPDRYQQPLWDGTPNPSARLLVWGDQNIGDEMQFAQIFPELRARVGHITVECDPRLVPLFQRSFPWLTVVPRGERAPEGTFDLQCPSGHLGGLFRSTPGAFTERTNGPWLHPDPKKVARLRARYLKFSGGRPIVGIAWKSKNIRFQGKNVPLVDWEPVLKTPGVFFISVQYGEIVRDLAELEAATGLSIPRDAKVDPMVDLDGFATQLAALDLVISTSNSTVHQACALGRPVWSLVHVRPDWRWGRRGDRSPWFPTLRLYRQTQRDNWAAVLDQIATDLKTWTGGRPGTVTGASGSN
jgi:hypothetical protein